MQAPIRAKLLPVFALVAAVFGGGLLTANLVDWVRYRRAIDRLQDLSSDQLRAIGDFCRDAGGNFRFGTDDVPEVFRPLQPTDGSVLKGLAEVRLYGLGDAGVWLRVVTSSRDQQISWSSSSFGRPRQVRLWVREPAVFKQFNPDGRLLTLAQWTMRDLVEWIVLRDRVLVVRRNSLVRDDELLASAPLPPERREEIVAATRRLRTEVGGMHFQDDDVMDGLQLTVLFSPDGTEGVDDVVLANAWSEVVGPIVDLVNRAAPSEYPLGFREDVGREEPGRRRIVTVRTLREHERLFRGVPRTAWWCWWRALAVE